MTTISSTLKTLEHAIAQSYAEENTTFAALELLAKTTRKSKASLLSCLREKLTNAEEKQLSNLLKRIANQEPVQYILGQTAFYGETFRLSQDTLIPRPETESLVAAAIDYLNEGAEHVTSKLSVLDVGTGSGAIIISIAAHLNSPKRFKFYATDKSEAALRLARENSSGPRINFVLADLFPTGSAPEKFDLITANLPYLSFAEYKALPAHIKNYEPNTALVGGKNGTEIVEELLVHLRHKLTSKGICLIELPPKHKTWLFETCEHLGLTAKKVDENGYIWQVTPVYHRPPRRA